MSILLQKMEATIAKIRIALKIDQKYLAQELSDLVQDCRDIAEGRQALELDRAAWAAEIAAVKQMSIHPEDRVLLDVGGTHYTTTRKTLTAVPGSMLEIMFSGRHEEQNHPNAEGRVQIDRNGSAFPFFYILNFLRDYSLGNENAAASICALPEGQMKSMKIQLDYYGIEDAVFPQPPFAIEETIFSPGPDMIEERMGFGAVVLPNIKHVMVVGGMGEEPTYLALAETEVLNLNTGRFTRGPVMGSHRKWCTAVAMNDGRVVGIGGRDSNLFALSTTEVLDSLGNTWSQGPGMASARSHCAAIPLTDHHILVIGGHDEGSCLSTTEVIDLTSGLSTPGPNMDTSRAECSAVMLDDGRVLVVGGYDGDNHLSTTEILDMALNISSPGPQMSSGRTRGAAVLLPEEGGVLVVGGTDNDVTYLATTEVLDVNENSTSPGPAMGSTRGGSGAVKLGDDRILVIGGIDDDRSLLSTSEVLHIPGQVALRQKRRQNM